MSPSGLGIEELPKTFRDAVEITRRLNLRYLWIDSLCIVQDDPNDWEFEASRMASIYLNGYITLAASASPDCHGGLIHPFVPAIFDTFKERTLCVRMSHTHSREQLSPLKLRGWVLQEELLSRRTLAFGERQLHWNCACTSASEDGLLDNDEYFLQPFRSSIPSYDPNTTSHTHLTKMYEFWRGVSEDYSRRNLSFIRDKLPAFAGITSRYRDLIGDTPLLGLWQRDIIQGLLWNAEIGSFRDTNSNIPTWTWLSMGGRIQYNGMWAPVMTRATGMTSDDSKHVEPKAILLSSSLLGMACP